MVELESINSMHSGSDRNGTRSIILSRSSATSWCDCCKFLLSHRLAVYQGKERLGLVLVTLSKGRGENKGTV